MNRHEAAKFLERALRPGMQMELDPYTIHAIAPIPGYTVPESIMENIVGSSYEFQFFENPVTGGVIFRRRREPLTGGRRTYVSPDRRHHFSKPDGDGNYHLLPRA